MTPLLFAVRDGNVEMTRLLLDQRRGYRPVLRQSHLAVADRSAQRTGRDRRPSLLEKGADPNAADDYHRAALFAAIDLRNFNHENTAIFPPTARDPLDLIKALLKKEPILNVRTDTVPVHGLMQFDASWVNFDGQTPFVRAALSGDIEVMRLLLENGADPNIATTQGTTALMAAAGINWIPGADLQPQRGRLCRSRQALPGARRRCERRQFARPHRHARRGQSRLGVGDSDPGRSRRQMDAKDNEDARR